MKDQRGKRNDRKALAARASEAAAEFSDQPPKKRPLLLAVSSLLIVAWIVFLAVMAFRH